MSFGRKLLTKIGTALLAQLLAVTIAILLVLAMGLPEPWPRVLATGLLLWLVVALVVGFWKAIYSPTSVVSWENKDG